MPRSARRTTDIHLARLLLVAAAGVFVTALIAATDSLQTLWPLYILPIVIGALAYHVAGAVLTTAIAAALVAFMIPGADVDAATITALVIGMVAFLISGVVIGAQAGRSLHHAQELEDASIRDPLTRLFKREYLITRLGEELRRAERFQLPCTLALARVDRFEEFKSQFGPYKAEVLLQHLSDVLLVTARAVDIVGRYGEIDFAAILPATDTAGAAVMARRIADAVAKTEFEGDVLEPATHCTVSLATATYPVDGTGRNGLIQLAEERLARASEAGSSEPGEHASRAAAQATLEGGTAS